MVSKSGVLHRLIRLSQVQVVLHMHNNELALSSREKKKERKKQNLRISGSLSKPAGLLGCKTVVVTLCGFADVPWVLRAGLVLEGEHSMEIMAI